MAYSPAADSVTILDGILDLLPRAATVAHSFKRAPSIMATLPGGELYFDSSLELDTDGLPDGGGRGDAHWQPSTSLRYSDGGSVDSNAVPYFVLPLPAAWPGQFGISLGDYAAVIRRGRLAYAVFADFGHNPGEGSLELLRRLGTERLRDDGSIVNAGAGSGVITIVFPGSGPGSRPTSQEQLLSGLQNRAPGLFTALGGREPIQADGRRSSREAPTAAPGLQIASGLAERVVAYAEAELERFGDCLEDQPPLRERIGEYWKAIGSHFDGADHDAYWSAVFVSFMVRLAGGENTFKCSSLHSRYVNAAIRDREAAVAGRYWAYRTSELAPVPGDILAMNRGSMRALDFEEARLDDDFPSHGDIVVKVDAKAIHTIGGNVGRSPGTIGTKIFRWSGGVLRNARDTRQQVYAVLRPPAVT